MDAAAVIAHLEASDLYINAANKARDEGDPDTEAKHLDALELHLRQLTALHGARHPLRGIAQGIGGV